MAEITVIVPLFNKASTVQRALASVSSQSFQDWEAIVVDDGSTDGSGQLAASWPDPRVRVLTQSNAGPGAARNAGWRLADSPFIAFLDADDEWEPDFLLASRDILRQQDVAFSAFAFRYEPGGQLPQLPPDGIWKPQPDTHAAELVARLAFCWPCSMLFRREVLLRFEGFYSRDACCYAEDAHLFLKILLNEPVWMGHRPLARFHREDSALSGNYKKMRPVEPFLTHPDGIRDVCPRHWPNYLRIFLSASL